MGETDFLILLVAVNVIQFLVYCIYLKNLNSLLKAIRPANRYMAPGRVWLLLLWGMSMVLGLLSSEELGHVYLLNTDQMQRAYTITNAVVYLFLLVWHFRVISGVAISIEREYRSRNLPVSNRPTYYPGLLMLALALPGFGNFFDVNRVIYDIVQTCSLLNMVAWIIYWVKTHRYKKKIQAMPEYPEEDERSVFFNLYYPGS